MSDSNSEQKNLPVLAKISVDENGKLHIKGEYMPELFGDFIAEFWSGQISTIGLSGNRQALRANLELYRSYFSLSVKNKEAFIGLAKRKGYRLEAIEELWADLNDIYLKDFIEFVKNKINPAPKKEQDEFVL